MTDKVALAQKAPECENEQTLLMKGRRRSMSGEQRRR